MRKILSAMILCAVVSAMEANAQRQQPVRRTKKEIVKDNARMKAELDSLHSLLEEYAEIIRRNETLRTDLMDVFEENEGKIGAGLSPEDYNTQVTDSLLNFWYLHRQTMQSHEGEDYDMDSVHFSSNVPDSVFLQRLAKIHSFITLPYNETVRNYIILYSEKMPTKVQQMLGLASYYFPIFEETFNRYKMPEELKYMAVIESALNPVAVSRAGAKGMWQFMYNTAKLYGLKIDSFVDERLDPVKSADAAARYLQDAYGIFGDWSLAISAYNCGSGNVNKAIRRSGKRDFWSIYPYLPKETRGYVPAMVGAMYAFNYYKECGLVPSAVQMPAAVDTFEVHRMLHFKQINEVAKVPMDELKQLNPQYVHDIIPGTDASYVLRLPYNYSGSFIENEDSVYAYKAAELFNPTEIQNIRKTGYASGDRIVYSVKSGDYLGRIATRHHVTVNQLKQWNHLKNNNLRIGQKIIIYGKGATPKAAATTASTAKKTTPTQASSAASKTSASTQSASASQSAASAGTVTYTVKKGDTLYGIAKQFPGVSANDIMKLNGIGANIKVGMKIKIPKK